MDWVSLIILGAIGLAAISVMLIIAKDDKKIEDEKLYHEILEKHYGEINNY